MTDVTKISLVKLTVLVVDDDDIQRLMCREALEQAGFNVLEAEDGLPALEIFRSKHIDILLLDVMMTELDGFETCRRIRSLDSGLHTPILMMTGLEDVESIDYAYRVGATDFVTKPINYSVLPRRVQYMHRATATAAELLENKYRLEAAQRMAGLGHWEWRDDTKRLICSLETERLLGVKNDSEIELSDLLHRLYPNDRDRFAEALSPSGSKHANFEDTFKVVDGKEICFLHQEAEIFAIGPARGVRATIQDVTKLRVAQQKAHRSTYYDEITNLPNRLLLTKELESAFNTCKREKKNLALLAIDLDEFKRINDSLGHSVGDRVLQRVGEVLKTSVRLSDLPGRKDNSNPSSDLVISRMGGDEFVVVLNDIRSVEDAAIVARRIQRNLTQPIQIDDKEIVLSCSIGIGAYPNDCEDSESLLKNAVAAMNHAKASGRDRYQFYDSSMNARAFERLSMESNLRKALEEEQFELYFQPKISIKDGMVVGAEALIRWIHPELGIISPVDFIPVAEETGLVLPIGEWIIKNAAATVRQWRDNDMPPLQLAINVSATQFSNPKLAGFIAETVKAQQVPPSCIEVEITESLLLDNIDEVVGQLFELKEHGIEIWIDDFGTGYSSLSYLKQLPISGLKVDQSFVRDMVTNENDEAIVSAVIGLAKNLQLRVVAEGVEENEQLTLLAAKNCDVAQGYLYSKPINNAEFQAWVSARMATQKIASTG